MSNKTKWMIDPIHSEIAFKVRHLMITFVKGEFKEYGASIYTTGNDFLTSEVDFWVNAASVDTGAADRDTHVRSADFLDVENHPQINFSGNTYEKVDDDGSYEMYGDLTIKGITKRIKLDVEFGGVMKDPWGNEKAGFTVNGKIHRGEWDLNWNAPLDSGGVLVGDDVHITCEIQLLKSSEDTLTADEVVVIPEQKK